MSYTVTPIGTVTSSRTQAVDDHWDQETSHIALDLNVVDADAAAGLDDFSHIEVIYVFHKVLDSKIVTGARHPRGNTDWPKAGILAQRGKNRPNKLGATICELDRVEGSLIRVRGLDAIDGTPVLDIKPVMTEFLPRSLVTQPVWSTEVMRDYWS